MVVAYDKNRAIGANNQLLWKRDLPADLRHFRDLTHGDSIVMGRKTFESIGSALPGRKNIVVSHHFKVHDNITFARSLKEAYDEAGNSDVAVIGGASIYEQALDDVQRIYATEVHAEFRGADTHFPDLHAHGWRETRREPHYADGANKYDYDFVVYEKR